MEKNARYKIFNDPVHGFISVPKGLILQLIDHPYLQRLRRIRQLGTGHLVFPAAEHSRFSHALGALELTKRVLNNLREKNTTISEKEYEATLIAILLHDIGHGPLSHALEHTFIRNFSHEQMSLAFMKELNAEFGGALDTAIAVFTNRYKKKFLHQLISSQLDLDRLDYLRRDSFFTGVTEGAVGVNRILETMRVFNGNIVIEKKGIYAVENYILSRRLMYMQVYLHKTALSADALLLNIFKRVHFLIGAKAKIPFVSPAMRYFLTEQPDAQKQITKKMITNYARLDDHDVLQSLKIWSEHEDVILSDLCSRYLNRVLFRTSFFDRNPTKKDEETIRTKTKKALKKVGLPHSDEALTYYYSFDQSYTEAYKYKQDSIWILDDDHAVEFSKAADTKSIIALTEPVIKHYCVHLKEVEV